VVEEVVAEVEEDGGRLGLRLTRWCGRRGVIGGNG